MTHLPPILLADSATIVDGVTEQVEDFIETAGSRAGDMIYGLPFMTTKALFAALAIVIGAVLIRIGRRMIASIIRMRGHKDRRTEQQLNTLKSLMQSVFNYIMYFIIAMVVLSIFDVDVRSLLAVAGISSIAIGFGAQRLVEDVISGMFIWIEGSIGVSDIVDINGLQGEVESVSIRCTVVRNFNGNVQVIPNGEIRSLTNMSRGFKRAIVDVRCPYEEDQARIVKILEEEMEIAGKEIVGLSAPPDVLSILSFETDCVLVRLAAQCPIGEHWRIERELRTRVKARFDKEGIVMPHYQKPIVS